MENDILIEIAQQLKRIADALEKANEVESFTTKPIEVKEVKYKENTEIGKAEVPVVTCGLEVCRCLRNDGTCGAHHPDFCKKCKELNHETT